jgi:hypothetical protein
MAGDEVKVKKDRDPIFTVCLVVFIIAVAAVAGSSLYSNYIEKDNTLAASGNTVEVDYTGTYYSYFGEPHAVVFDTSCWSVADGDSVKSNDFTGKDEASYAPLSFKVGGTDVLAGFGNAVIGHKVGDKIRVLIPAGEGYNSADTAKTVLSTDVSTVKAVQTMSSAQFEAFYGYKLLGVEPNLTSPYGWPAHANYNTVNDTVTIYNKPVAGQSYDAVDDDFGTVSVTVVSVGSDSVSYKMSVTKYVEVGSSGSGKSIQMIKVDLGYGTFYITSVVDGNGDGTAESFTYKAVEERYNQDLYFEIEIVLIKQ